MKVKHTQDVALLHQNHRIYLEHAAKINAKEPARTITFRATDLWRSGKAALHEHGPRRIYLAPTDEDRVEYVGRLERVHLEPETGDPETEALLAQCLPETRDQGLWEQYGDQVRTLYVLSHVRRVPEPFAFTRLTKLSDEQPVDAGYNSGYVIVYAYCASCQSSPCRCERRAGAPEALAPKGS
jgi:hypothetical protein